MYGYFDQQSKTKRTLHSAAIAGGAATLFGAIAFRERIGEMIARTGASLLRNDSVKETASKISESALSGAIQFQSYLRKWSEGKSWYRTIAAQREYTSRSDFQAYQRSREETLNMAFEQRASRDIKNYLQTAGGWSDDRINSILSRSGTFSALLHQTDRGEMRTILQKSADFQAQLLREVRNDEAAYDQALRDSVTAFDMARRSLGYQREPTESAHPLTEELKRLYKERLKREGEYNNYLEQLTGVSRQRIVPSEVVNLRKELGEGINYSNLRSSSANAKFYLTRNGKTTEYDLSGLRSAALTVKDYLADRFQVPLSPFQTGISVGQLFPFLPRAGDQPIAARVTQNLIDRRLEYAFDGKVISYDAETQTAQVSVTDTFDTLKINKRHLKDLSAAQAEIQGEHEASLLHSVMHGSLFQGFGREPGSTPYWGVFNDFFRKFTAPDYLPNILRKASEFNLTGEHQVSALIDVMRSSGLRMDDSEFGRFLKDLNETEYPTTDGETHHLIPRIDDPKRDTGLPRLSPKINDVAVAISKTEGSASSRYAGAFKDIQSVYDGHFGMSPKVLRMLRDMSGMNLGDRERYFERTASYEESRHSTTLFGLDISLGANRVTNLDIFRSEMFQDMLKISTIGNDSRLENTARRFAQRNDLISSFVTQSKIFERRLSADTNSVDSINSYLEHRDSAHLRNFLEQESRKRFNFLDLHPKTQKIQEDFANRQKALLIRTSRDPSRDGFLNLNRIYRSYTDPQSMQNGEITHGALQTYWALNRLHSAFAELGIGLPAYWKATPSRLALGMVFGRYLPIFIGIPEAHKLYNRITRDVPFLRPINLDYHRANLLDVYGRVTHRGNTRRHLLALLPGLDFYFDDKSYEDERRSQRGAGYTPVRKGRWWTFGSREAFFGDHISYYAPSASRIARSDWQAAPNVQRNNWRYWEHFGGYLNPFNWGKGAYWQEESMLKDRPYLKSGPAFDPDHPWSTPLNFAFGWLLKPRKIYHPEYLPRRFGGKLEDLPTEIRPTSPYYKRLKKARYFADTQYSRGTRPGKSYRGKPLSNGWVLTMPRPSRVRDASNDPLLERINAYRRIRKQRGLSPDSNEGISPEETAYLNSINMDNGFTRSIYHAQEIAGLYGWFIGLTLPRVAAPYGAVEIANPSRAYGRERRFYDQEVGGLGGGIADTLRRFLPHRRRALQQYDPVPNRMPSWLPGQEYLVDFRRGDAFSKIPLGELRLPSESYERTHPGTRSGMFRMRASSFGKTTEEMEEHLLRKEGDGTSSRAAEEGTKIHRILQNRWRALGLLEGSEIEVYDQELNMTGHIDAILRMVNRRGQFERTIVDIKTKSAERFNKIIRTGKPEEENLDQILFYMHTTGIKKGLLTYVDRDDVNRVFNVEVRFDRGRFNRARQRLQAARQNVLGMLDRGEIGRGELYDPVSKFEILSDVAPYSAEFANLQHWASQNKESLTKEEQKRLEDAQDRVKRLKQGFELHHYRFRKASLESRNIRIDHFVDREHFVDTSGQRYSLAGVKALGGETGEAWWLNATGLRPGSRVSVTYDRMDRKHLDGLHTVKASVTSGFHNVNKNLLQTGHAEEDQDDFSPVSNYVRFSGTARLIGRVAEWFAHQDTPFHTKFLPVRSGLEEYERTDVYGKKSGSWEHPLGSYIWPTLTSLTNKNPLSAAAMGASLSYLFFIWNENRLKALKVGALIGIGLSAFGLANRAMGHPFIARAVRRRRALDTYYDTLTYVKYRRLAAQESELARRQEGVNTHDIQSQDKNVSEDQKTYLKGLREIREDLIKKRNQLEARAKKLQRILPTYAKSLRNQSHGYSDEISITNREVKRVQREDRYPIGPHALQAVLYEQRYKATVRGGLEGGSWQAALSALPKRSRSAIVDVINHGTPKEKLRLFRLLPQDQKALLGYALGAPESQIPKVENLAHYFQGHPLPIKEWEGWNADISLDLLKSRDVARRPGLDPMDFGIFPNMVAEATEGSPEAYLPLPEDHSIPTLNIPRIQRDLRDILSGYGLASIKVDVTNQESADSDQHEAELNIKIGHRRENHLFQKFKRSHKFQT